MYNVFLHFFPWVTSGLPLRFSPGVFSSSTKSSRYPRLVRYSSSLFPQPLTSLLALVNLYLSCLFTSLSPLVGYDPLRVGTLLLSSLESWHLTWWPSQSQYLLNRWNEHLAEKFCTSATWSICRLGYAMSVCVMSLGHLYLCVQETVPACKGMGHSTTELCVNLHVRFVPPVQTLFISTAINSRA